MQANSNNSGDDKERKVNHDKTDETVNTHGENNGENKSEQNNNSTEGTPPRYNKHSDHHKDKNVTKKEGNNEHRPLAPNEDNINKKNGEQGKRKEISPNKNIDDESNSQQSVDSGTQPNDDSEENKNRHNNSGIRCTPSTLNKNNNVNHSLDKEKEMNPCRNGAAVKKSLQRNKLQKRLQATKINQEKITKGEHEKHYEYPRNRDEVKHETDQETQWKIKITIMYMIQATRLRNSINTNKISQDTCPPVVATYTYTGKDPQVTGHPSLSPALRPHPHYLRHTTTKPVLSGEANLGTHGISGGKIYSQRARNGNTPEDRQQQKSPEQTQSYGNQNKNT